MGRKKRFRFVCVFLVLLLLFLSGCTAAGQESGSGSGSQQENGSNDNQKKDEEGNKDPDNEETDNNKEPKGEDPDSEKTDSKTVLYGGGAYSDIILDRSLTEGKFAVYFFRTDANYSSYTGSAKGGDSVLLIAPDGTTMLYDCSTVLNDAYIVYALQQLGIEKLDYFVNSHPHLDHLGGFSLLARYIKIGHVYMPIGEEAYNDVTVEGGFPTLFMETIKEYGIPYSALSEGDTFQFSPDISVKVYNPPADLDLENVDENEWSLALKFVYKNASVLLAGDCGNNEAKLGRATESELVAKYGSELQADVSKMNHHGDGDVSGNTKAGSAVWRNAVNSKIYVGMRSSVTSEKTFLSYMTTGAKAFHSALDGTVLVYTTGDGTYEVQVERERNNDYYGHYDTVDGHMTVR